MSKLLLQLAIMILITDYLIIFEIGKQFIMLLALENSNSPQSMLLIRNN